VGHNPEGLFKGSETTGLKRFSACLVIALSFIFSLFLNCFPISIYKYYEGKRIKCQLKLTQLHNLFERILLIRPTQMTSEGRSA